MGGRYLRSAREGNRGVNLILNEGDTDAGFCFCDGCGIAGILYLSTVAAFGVLQS